MLLTRYMYVMAGTTAVWAWPADLLAASSNADSVMLHCGQRAQEADVFAAIKKSATLCLQVEVILYILFGHFCGILASHSQ